MGKSRELLIHARLGALTKPLILEISDCTDVVIENNSKRVLELVDGGVGTVLLLDLSLYGEDINHPKLVALFRRAHGQKVIVLTGQQDEARLYALFLKGVRGFCDPDITPEMLAKAIDRVEEGELWISRKLTAYFMGRLHLGSLEKEGLADAARTQKAPLGIKLTEREIDVANCVARGQCDKVVAMELNISPNTVKNHLRNIYKKLNVTDRFQLSLICHGIQPEDFRQSA